jgi:hypothetical protein
LAPTAKVAPTVKVAVPLPLNVPVLDGELVKAFTVILLPGPVKVVELGRVTEKVELAFPDKLNAAALPVAVEESVTFVPVLAPAALITTVPALVVGATAPNTKSAVLVIVTGARMVTLAFAVAVAACEVVGCIAITPPSKESISAVEESERVWVLIMIVSCLVLFLRCIFC